MPRACGRFKKTYPGPKLIFIFAPNFCRFREDDGGNLTTGMSNMTKKDVPLEIMLIDSELKEFFSLDITAITREGKVAEGTVNRKLYFWYYLREGYNIKIR